jgi:hypothetical protein
MLAERYVPLKRYLAVMEFLCARALLLTVNTYFFVSTTLKVPTKFSFGIGMVNTEKYRPIPTEKYRPGKQLYKYYFGGTKTCPQPQNSY